MIIIIPSAGKGTRLKPHTLSTPKPLFEVAGKPILSYILEETKKFKPEKTYIIVKYKKDDFKKYLEEKKLKKTILVEQEDKKGDAIAIKNALEKIKEKKEILIFFGDTLIDFDLKKILKEKNNVDSLVFVKKVEEPQHYGVIELEKGMIKSIEEKPEKPKSNLALIGAYYFKDSKYLHKKIKEIIEKKLTIKGEYKLAKALELMLKENKKIKPLIVKEWYDCGRPKVLLEANKYFLEKKAKEKNKKNKEKIIQDNSLIVSPTTIGKNTKIEKSIIGPYTSISKNAIIKNSIIENTIILEGAIIENTIIKDSIIGKNSIVKSSIKKINVGEQSDLHLDY